MGTLILAKFLHVYVCVCVTRLYLRCLSPIFNNTCSMLIHNHHHHHHHHSTHLMSKSVSTVWLISASASDILTIIWWTMPGLQALGRRWSIGSDDLILPASILFVAHSIWLILLVCLLGYVSPKEWKILCMRHLHELVIGYLVLLSGSLVVEICIAWVSCRGSIMNTKPRSSIQYILYVRAGKTIFSNKMIFRCSLP